MKEAEVKVTLSDGNVILKKWEQPCQTDLPKVLETVKHLKQSVNEYLTELIGNQKNSSLGEQTELSDVSDEEEELEGNTVSGFIKHTASASEKSEGGKKRKYNYVNKSKKLKR